MREIKFRGVSQYTGQMVYGQLLRGVNDFNIVTKFNHIDDFGLETIVKGTQAQYIGVEDLNSKEIYEKDIIKFKHINEDKWQYSDVMYFGDAEWNYPAYDLNATHIDGYFEGHILNCITESGEYEYYVVGNTFENPELIK